MRKDLLEWQVRKWRVRKHWLFSGCLPCSGPGPGLLCAQSSSRRCSLRGRLTPDAVRLVRCPPLTSPRGGRRAGPGGASGPGRAERAGAPPGWGGVEAGSPAGGGGRGRARSHGGGVTGVGSGRPTRRGGGRGGGSAEPAPAGEQRRLRGPGPGLSRLR